MDNEKLKPCPFCGGEATAADGYYYEGDWQWAVVVCRDRAYGCEKTAVQHPWSTQAAIAAWNRRTPVEADLIERQAAEIERLHTVVTAFNNGMPPMTTKDAITEINRQAAEIKRLRGALEACLEELYTPEPACSCHISPPCGDCVEYSSIREVVEIARAALEAKP